MAKPWTHAQMSVKKFGGKEEDYIKIHEVLDSAKSAVPDNRGRCFYHNSHFIYYIMPMIFGTTITNSDGKVISVSLISEDHVSSDYRYKFIPSPQDWVDSMEMRDWMNNAAKGDVPPSYRKMDKVKIDFKKIDLDKITNETKDIIDKKLSEEIFKTITNEADTPENLFLDGASQHRPVSMDIDLNDKLKGRETC